MLLVPIAMYWMLCDFCSTASLATTGEYSNNIGISHFFYYWKSGCSNFHRISNLWHRQEKPCTFAVVVGYQQRDHCDTGMCTWFLHIRSNTYVKCEKTAS